MLISVFPLLPLLSTPLVIWKEDSRNSRIFHLVAWSLAVVPGSFWSLLTLFDPHTHKGRLWGIWTYLGLAIGMLVLEALALVA
jgi:hypothetical protein